MSIKTQLPTFWPTPKSFNVGLFTDLRLYYDALIIAENYKNLTIESLNELLPERVVGLKYVQSFENKTSEDLFRELNSFNFIWKGGITEEGKKLIDDYKNNPIKYHHTLIKKMNDYYTVPGWFVSRLWDLNHNGQGQIVIPSPIKDWQPKPSKREWQNNLWDSELEEVCRETINKTHKFLPDSFPIDTEEWIKNVKTEFERIGQSREQVRFRKTKEIEMVNYFSLRRRLSISMKNVTIKKMFGNLNIKTEKNDFYKLREPVNSRTFMVWCSRLEALELIFYTDYTILPGRLIFPTSVFRNSRSENEHFTELKFLKNPQQQILYLHKPNWFTFKDTFVSTLYEVYQSIYDKDGVIYISLQQLRDEVCRQLRISASTFESFLQKSFELSIKREIDFAISLETDLRDEQKTQVLRRGVFINNVQNSLIAIRAYLN